MTYMKPISSLIFLAILSLVNGDFTAWANWILTQNTGAGTLKFQNIITGSTPYLAPSDSSSVDSATSCGSFSKNGESWTLDTDYTAKIPSQTPFVVGFWVNFKTTANSPKVFQFGSDSGAHYIVSSVTDGNLKVVFYSDSTATDPKNDFSITVDTDKWNFLAFEFLSSGVNVYQSQTNKLPITKAAGATVDFALPNGQLSFGANIVAKFYEVAVAATIGINDNGVYIEDGTFSKQISNGCPMADCIDNACTSNGICLSWSQYCTDCSGTTCSACDPDSARTEDDWCQSCQALNTLLNGHCCLTTNNCVGCSVKSTACDSCSTGNFLYDDPVALTTACLSCADSCTSCKPGPSCYNCAEAIVQDGSSCNVESIGFQASVEVPNIVLNFAHPLSTGLSQSSFKATSSEDADIPTGQWAFNCAKGSLACTIVTTNVKESDLPLTLDVEFLQV